MFVSTQQISGLRARGARIAAELAASRAAMSDPSVPANAKAAIAPLQVKGSRARPVVQARFGRTVDVSTEQGVITFLGFVKNRASTLPKPVRVRIDDLIAERRRQAAIGVHTAPAPRRDDRGAR